MAYTMIDNHGTEFAIDWEIVSRLNYSYHVAEQQWIESDISEMSESAWYNPFSWSLPTVKSVDVDWVKVRQRAKTASDGEVYRYRNNARRDVRDLAYELEYRLEQTVDYRKKFTNQLKEVQAANSSAIQESVDDYDGLIEVAKFVRDSSADVVILGSTIATGGAAGALMLGAGSTMKGAFKYQDTGSVGAAVVCGGGNLILGAFKIKGAKLSTKGEYALIVAKGFLESTTSLVAGDTFSTAFQKGTLKVASAGAAQAVFAAKPVQSFFSRIPLPFEVWDLLKRDGPNVMYGGVANKVVEKTTKKAFEKGTKYAAGQGAAAIAGNEATPPAARSTSAGLADQVPLEKKLLLYFSIVNMEKGIGRGW